MDIKNQLQIVLITYNRKEFLQNTLLQIFADNSSIKDFDITILNNNSTDGTTELLNEYSLKYSNLTHIKNKINIGGNANICKAFAEYLNKEYIWVLCDNDFYNWECWKEIEDAVNNQYDMIMTRNCNNDIGSLFFESTFVPAAIYKTQNITSTVVTNMYDNVRYFFPHLAISAKNINDNNKIYIVSKDIVTAKIFDNHPSSYVRGIEKNDLPEEKRYMYWSVGYYNSIKLIKNREKQIEIINLLIEDKTNMIDMFKTVIIRNRIYYNGYCYNLFQIFRVLGTIQKLKFICAYICVYCFFKNYKFYEIKTESEWLNYLTDIQEQKYIDKLAKKLKNKKIVLYGAGMLAEILLKHFDLSKLNIVGISDKRFEASEEKEFYNIKTIKPSQLKNVDFDIILFTMKLYQKIETMLKKQGIKQKTLHLIKKSLIYEIRN